MLSDSGPAFQSLALAERKQVGLLVSPYVLEETRDVLSRPQIRSKNPHVTPERIQRFLDLLARKAILIEQVPHLVDFTRDRKDEPYLDLAVAGGARHLVTRDAKHLLRFFNENTPEALAFRRQYPALQIVDPGTFLREVSQRGEPTSSR